MVAPLSFNGCICTVYIAVRVDLRGHRRGAGLGDTSTYADREQHRGHM
jgi:hypothetical protein